MKMKVMAVVLAGLAWAASPVGGQETQKEPQGILQAIALPTVSEILRDRGVPVEEVEATIFGAREKGVPADETAGFLEATARAVEENGPIENFGAFVQAQLDAGLRGHELAQAIRAEHARRGIGRGKKLESGGRGQGGQDRPGAAGPGQGRGRPDAADSTARQGPPGVRDQGARRRDTVPDSTPRGGGNGGEA